MSPELIDPDRFGLEKSRPTSSSDCYALGMVIYETISGHLPFHAYTDLSVFVKVLEGKRPSREGKFVDNLWETLERCWTPQPNARPRVEDVLQYLERVSRPLDQSSTGINGKVNNRANSSSGMFYHFIYATFRGFSTFVHLHQLYSLRAIIFRLTHSEDVD